MSRTMMTTAILLGTTLTLACGGGAIAPLEPDPSATPTPTASPSPSPSESPHPTMPPEPAITPRGAQRVTVAHLRRSIPRLFDGITWTNGARNNPRPMFDVLSRTLGEADYVQATVPNTAPNPIFAKFMDDMAGQVCAQAVAADAQATSVLDKTVTPYGTDTLANLRYLRLKLHGIHVPDGSSEGLEALQALHDEIIAEGGTAADAWTGVCVAMLTAPETMAY